jgi:hypothetical protein
MYYQGCNGIRDVFICANHNNHVQRTPVEIIRVPSFDISRQIKKGYLKSKIGALRFV